MPADPRPCARCGIVFRPSRGDQQRFHDVSCRKQARREREAGEAKVDPNSLGGRVGRLIAEHCPDVGTGQAPKSLPPGTRRLEWLSREAGLSVETLRKLRNGHQGDIRPGNLDKIVSTLDPSLAWLGPADGGFSDVYAELFR